MLWRFHQNCIKIVHWKDDDLSSIKTTSKKVLRNKEDFSPIEITSNGVRWNETWIFYPSRLRRVKNVEAMRILRIRHSSSKKRGFFVHRICIEKIRCNDMETHLYFIFDTYQHDIGIESTLIQRVISAWEILNISEDASWGDKIHISKIEKVFKTVLKTEVASMIRIFEKYFLKEIFS